MDEKLVEGHVNLTYKHLVVLIQQWKDGEWDLFLTIKDWLDADYKRRRQHLDSLMSHVRFSLLTPEQLEAVKKMKLYSEGSWSNNVQVGEEYYRQPIHKKMMRPTSVRNKAQPMCFSAENRSTIYTLEEDGQWKTVDVPEMPQFRFGFGALLEFNNCLVVAEDDSYQTWHVFDTSTLTWFKMEYMKTMRLDFTLVHDGRYLYALGGVDVDGQEGCYDIDSDDEDFCDDKALDTIERYDPGSNTWTVMKTRLPSQLCRVNACVCSGPFFSIYVAGGSDRLSFDGVYSSAMNCFNPYEESATWHKKAPMLIAEKTYVMREMAFCGKDPAIVIMCEDLVIQYYDLKTDQWSTSKAWPHVDIDWRWHGNGTVLSDPSENTLYVLNICEDFPGTTKNSKQGVCGKWPLSKNDDTILGRPVGKFPIKTKWWDEDAEPYYFAAILAVPRPSKRMIPTPEPSGDILATAPQSECKAKAKAKCSNRLKKS